MAQDLMTNIGLYMPAYLVDGRVYLANNIVVFGSIAISPAVHENSGIA